MHGQTLGHACASSTQGARPGRQAGRQAGVRAAGNTGNLTRECNGQRPTCWLSTLLGMSGSYLCRGAAGTAPMRCSKGGRAGMHVSSHSPALAGSNGRGGNARQWQTALPGEASPEGAGVLFRCGRLVQKRALGTAGNQQQRVNHISAAPAPEAQPRLQLGPGTTFPHQAWLPVAGM